MNLKPASAMAPAVRFARLNESERNIFVSALVAMFAVRVALFVMPVQRIIAASNRLSQRWPARASVEVAPSRVAKRIVQAKRFCPFSTCLSESIAGSFIMSRLGLETELRIGVAKASGKFEAHAWLECPDGVVIGNMSPEGKQFARMPSLRRFVA